MKSVVGAWNRTPHLVLRAKCGIWRIVRRMAISSGARPRPGLLDQAMSAVGG